MKYEDIQVGQKAELMRRISYRDILDFMMLSGDKNNLHTDENYVKTFGFKEPVVHGGIITSIISSVIGNQLPGNGALWKTQSFRFSFPVYVGDTIIIKAEVKSKHDHDRSIVLITDVLNQDGKTVVFGINTIRVLE